MCKVAVSSNPCATPNTTIVADVFYHKAIIIAYDNVEKCLPTKLIYNSLFKAELANYTLLDVETTYLVGQTIYYNEFDVILSHIHEIESIKIYSDNTVRLQFSTESFGHHKKSIFLSNVKTLINTLKNL